MPTDVHDFKAVTILYVIRLCAWPTSALPLINPRTTCSVGYQGRPTQFIQHQLIQCLQACTISSRGHLVQANEMIV